MLNLIYITLILIFIIDRCGFIEHVKDWFKKWLHITDISFKPFDCSLCMVHHIGLIYLLCTHFTLPLYVFLCFMSLSTTYINYLLDVIFETIEFLIYKFEQVIKKHQ